MQYSKKQQPLPGYTVRFPIKEGINAETYRLVDGEKKAWFFKLFHPERLAEDRFNSDGRLRELVMLESLDVDGVPSLKEVGELDDESPYALMEFVPGETLDDRLRRDYTLMPEVVMGIMESLAAIVTRLHDLEDPVIHNEICPENVLLDLTADPNGEPKLIDFGNAIRLSEGQTEHPVGVNPYYQANECFEGVSSKATDVFALGATCYHALFGMPPWGLGVSKYRAERVDIRGELVKARLSPLGIPHLATERAMPNSLLDVLKKSMAADPAERYPDGSAFLKALRGESAKEAEGRNAGPVARKSPPQPLKPLSAGKPLLRGFDAIAGMEDLKRILNDDVVGALKDREQYEEYGLEIPNGMLLYGPPGCGKTFMAERFAEEVGLNFRSLKPSDFASIYVHGAQEKIGQLFDEARKEAPSVLFLDELDAILPNRENGLHHSYASEVNEFLAQMSNCSQDGIFIIGATNRPELIDPAILRTGRMDKVVYVGPPDFAARKAMFQLHLTGRPCEASIDLDDIAGLTDGRVSSDIKFLVNEAARLAMKNKTKIGTPQLQEAVRNHAPSVSPEEIAKYETSRKRFESGREGKRDDRPTLGFAIPSKDED